MKYLFRFLRRLAVPALVGMVLTAAMFVLTQQYAQLQPLREPLDILTAGLTGFWSVQSRLGRRWRVELTAGIVAGLLVGIVRVTLGRDLEAPMPLPAAFTPKQAMAIGTAGYTAALCVDALVDWGVTPDQGEVLVTGATGGVGSVAIALLKKLGFSVAALTGKMSEDAYLKSLGADTVIDRAEMAERGKPMQRERWAGVIDTAGSQTWPMPVRRPATAVLLQPAAWHRVRTFR